MKKIAILGTGSVAQTIGRKLIDLGHEVTLGSRTADNPKAVAWAGQAGARAHVATFADAAAAGQLLWNCTAGGASLQALKSAGADNLRGKVLIDVSNPLDFSRGFPPTLTVCNTDSLGEQIQRAFPEALVVKALNTMTADLMVNPRRLSDSHQVLMCGNDVGAKAEVKQVLESFGWRGDEVIDLGDISNARGNEAWLLLWTRLYGALGSAMFNLKLVRQS